MQIQHILEQFALKFLSGTQHNSNGTQFAEPDPYRPGVHKRHAHKQRIQLDAMKPMVVEVEKLLALARERLAADYTRQVLQKEGTTTNRKHQFSKSWEEICNVAMAIHGETVVLMALSNLGLSKYE